MALPIVQKVDKQKGLITSLLVMVLLLLYFLFVSFDQADPLPKDIPVKLAEPIDITEIRDIILAGGSGGGQASDDPLDKPKPQTEEILTQTKNPKTQTHTGKGNTTNSANSQNQPSTSQQSDNPFSSGGSGTGNSGGDGGTFGGDSGTGTGGNGTGTGSGKNRTRLNNVNIDDLKYNSNETIHLKLVIDAEGNVVQAINIISKTTTTDQILINKVIVAVKKQVKYSKESGASLVAVFYTIGISAQ